MIWSTWPVTDSTSIQKWPFSWNILKHKGFSFSAKKRFGVLTTHGGALQCMRHYLFKKRLRVEISKNGLYTGSLRVGILRLSTKCENFRLFWNRFLWQHASKPWCWMGGILCIPICFDRNLSNQTHAVADGERTL